MSTSQPIALPPTLSASPDVHMASGSHLTPGTFNPASYTRHMLGSPLSWRAGSSFGNRFYPGASPIGQFDQSDFRIDRISSSVESDRGSIHNALRAMERADEHCRNYTCCGLNLTDLHALVDHFEECHVVVLDPYNPMPPASFPASYPAPAAGTPPATAKAMAHEPAPPQYQSGAFDPDDMELDQDSPPSSGASTPPETPVSTPVSSYPSPSLAHADPHAFGAHAPVSAFETRTLVWKKGTPFATGAFPRANDGAFPAYTGFADYSSALAPGAPAAQEDVLPLSPTDGGRGDSPFHSITPAMLFSPTGTPSGSRTGSPTPAHAVGGVASTSSLANALSLQPCVAAPSLSSPSGMSASGSASTPRASTTLSRPASSLLLSKPFKCPKQNCNKSYKQANGLKYHIQHGSCNFAPAKEMEEVSAVLASRRGGDGTAPLDTGAALESLTESELRDVEREAERRLKPFACGIGECQRRYKNMNGLRYHYQHSGDHGAIGLALLASGQHECLRHGHNKARHGTPASGAPSTGSTPAPTPTAPTPAQAPAPAASFAAGAAYTPAMTQQAYAYLTQQQQRYMAQPGAFAGAALSGLGLNLSYAPAGSMGQTS